MFVGGWVCVCLLLSVIIFAWKSVEMNKKWNKPSVSITYTQRDQVDNGTTNKQTNEPTTVKNGDLTVKQRNSNTQRIGAQFAFAKMAQFTVILLWEFFILWFRFLLWLTYTHTHARAHTTHSHTCLFIWWTHLNLCCTGSVYPFSITPPYEVEIESCCWAFSSSLYRSLRLCYENETMHVFISV